MRTSNIICCCLVLFALPSTLLGQAESPSDSLRDFVQGFYDWYVPKALNASVGLPWDLAIEDRSFVFSPQLVEELREDSAAQANVEGAIAGLDFDPFLGSQDPGDRYEVATIAQKGGSQWADIFGVWAGKRSSSPDVVAELVLKNGHWTFVNFHYPDGSDLATVLKMLREGRQKPSN